MQHPLGNKGLQEAVLGRGRRAQALAQQQHPVQAFAQHEQVALIGREPKFHPGQPIQIVDGLGLQRLQMLFPHAGQALKKKSPSFLLRKFKL